VSFGGVELSTEQINDRVAFVGLDGEVTGPSGGLPLGPLGELLPLPGGARGPSEAISLPPDAGLAVVVEDGRSYVSLWYTVAEMARRSSGLGPPPAPLLAPRPSDTPDGVGAALLDAVATDDVEAALALVDPVEGAAVYDYSGLYLPTLGTPGTAPADEDFSFDDATVTAEVDGELARVTLALTGVDAALQLPPGLAGAGTGAVPSDVSIDIIAVEREDGWYLSPGRSVTDALLGFLAGLDDEDLEGLLASLLGLDLPFAGPSTELPTADSLEPAPVEAGPAEFVPIDAPEALALREKLPLDVPGVQTLGHFDDAFRRAGDLSVTRVYGLAIGFADATITETEAPDGEPIVERFGDDVVIVGQRGGLEITVSVFGLADADAETVASSLYQAIADRA
jgi:hypothetical protein